MGVEAHRTESKNQSRNPRNREVDHQAQTRWSALFIAVLDNKVIDRARLRKMVRVTTLL